MQSYLKNNLLLKLFQLKIQHLLRLLFLGMVLGLIQGCCEQVDLKINAPLKTWAPYKQHQVVDFVNANEEVITFVAATQHYNQKATDKVCGTYNIETLAVTLQTLSDPDFKISILLSHQVLLSISAINTQYNSRNLYIKFNTLSEQYVSDSWRDIYTTETAVNGQNYQQVLHAYGDNMPGDLALADIIYTKDKGLIAFKTFAGGWYFLK